MLGIALSRVLRRPRLVLGVWLLGLAVALLAGLPVLLGLGALLNDRPVAAALARGQADPLFAELLSDNPALGAALLASLLGAALPGWLLSAALSGALLDALRRPGDPRRVVGRALVGRAAQTAPAMLRLFGLGLLLRLPLLLVLGGLAFALRKGLQGRGLGPVLLVGGGALLLGALLWSALSVALHFARLQRLDHLQLGHGRGATRRAVRAGLRLARRALPATVALALLSVAALLCTALGGRALGLRLDRAGAALVLVVALRQLVALCRSGLQLTVLAGVVEAASVGREGAPGPLANP